MLRGPMAPIIRAVDWSKTPLGPIAAWPRTLKGYVEMILEMPTPAIIFWGPEQTQLYNPGYAAIMGPRHPNYFGAPYRDCWPEAFPVIYPRMRDVLEKGESFRVENELFPLTRHGFTEEAYLTFTFSPLRDDRGQIAGILHPIVEVTADVLRDRRVRTLRAMAPNAGSTGTVSAFAALSSNPKDVPFGLYFSGADRWHLEAQCGTVPEAALERLSERAREVLASGSAIEVELPAQGRAWAVPVRRSASEIPQGALILGVSPGLAFDAAYREFFESVGNELAASLEAAQARHAEKAAIERELAARNRLTDLFEQAPAFVCTLRGPEHVFEMVNPLYQRLVGIHRPLIGLLVKDALPEVVGQGFIGVLDDVFRTGVPFRGNEIPVRLDRAADGRLDDAFVSFVYQPRRDVQGRVDGIDVFGFEVTSHVRARQAAEALTEQLRKSDENFRTLSETIPQQVWTAGPDGALDFVNGRVTEYFATPSAQILGAGWLQVIHPDDVPLAVERWTNALKTGEVYEIEFRLRRADGAYRWHLARAEALRGTGGAILRWFGTNTDIHEAKTIREDLKRRTEFEQHLVGIVSHDLRNPLNAILLSANNLGRRQSLDERAAKSVLRIQSSAERATRMIRDLLDFTQARLGGSLPIECRPVALPEVMRNVLEEVEAAHPGRHLDVNHEGELNGNWDADRIAQVVQNLTSNALNYSPETSRVKLATRGDGSWVTLSVHNDGAPISTDKLPKIFEPLQRGTAEVDRTGRSVGLGLYIVKHIVDAHGGTVDVKSTAQDGTTFVVRLPRDSSRGP